MAHDNRRTPDELADEEKLDDLDPLRHLREVDNEVQVDSDSAHTSAAIVVPKQLHNHRGSQIMKFEDISVTLEIDASPGCGGLAWPAGEVLSAYLVHRGVNYLSKKKVLELGSGTGLVGLIAAQLGAHSVCITDQAPLLNIMTKNVDINGLVTTVSVAELNWGEPLPADVGKQDIILAADCVYFEPAFPLLVQTLCDLVKDSSTEALFCYKKRRKADKRFFTLLKKHFSWEDIEDHPDRKVYERDAISLLRLHRRASQQLCQP